VPASCERARDFEAGHILGFFQSDAIRPKAKAMLAQWMTAMDAAGTRADEQEQAKFETMANALTLDLQ